MAFEELTASISADASSYMSEVGDASAVTDDLGGSVGDTSDGLFDLEPAGMAAGGALAGIGAGAQSALDSTRDMRDELGIAGETAEFAQDEMVDMATALSDGTFPIEDATGTLASLSEQGVDTEEDLMELAEASDTIADATGTSADSVADNLGPAMAGLGDDIEDLPEMQDAFALAVNDSVLETEDLAGVMEGTQDGLNGMGLNSEESAGLIAAFAEETGLSGQRLRRELRPALEDADGDMDQFAEDTGISADALDEWDDQLADSEGAADDYAQVVDDNTTFMDDLRSSFADVKLEAGQLLGPIDAIAPAMTAAGVAGIFFTNVNAGMLIPSMTTLSAASLPVTAPMMAIVGAVAALVAGVGLLAAAINNDWLGAATRFTDSIDRMRSVVEPFNERMRSEGAETFGFYRDVVDDAVGAVTGSVADHADTVMAVFGPMWEFAEGVTIGALDTISAVVSAGLALLRGDFDAAWEHIDGLMERNEERIEGLASRIKDSLLGIVPTREELFDAGASMIDGLTDGIEDRLPSAEGAIESVTDGIGEFLPSSDADRGELSRLTEAGASVPMTMAEGAESSMGPMGSAMGQLPGPPGDSGPSGNGSGGVGDVIEEIRRLRKTIEGMRMRMDLSVDSREFGDVIDERAEAVVDDVIT